PCKMVSHVLCRVAWVYFAKNCSLFARPASNCLAFLIAAASPALSPPRPGYQRLSGTTPNGLGAITTPACSTGTSKGWSGRMPHQGGSVVHPLSGNLSLGSIVPPAPQTGPNPEGSDLLTGSLAANSYALVP